MPTIQQSLGISLTPNTGVNEIFFEPVFQSIVDLGNFRVLTGITSKKKLGFVNKLEKILQKAIGCGFTPKGEMSVYDRTIEVDDYKVNMDMCVDDFKDTILEQLQKSGNMRYDLNGTVMMTMLLQSLQTALPNDYQRLLWFGDKASTDEFYNIADGLWLVHLPALVTANMCPYTDSLSGAPLPAGAATTLLRDVIKAQSLALKGVAKAEKRIFVSDSVWQGYYDDLLLVGGGDASRIQLINGIEELRIDGYLLVNNPQWDEYMTNDMGQPDSHLVLLTTPNNIILATNNRSDQNMVEVWYDKKYQTNSIILNGKFGVNYVHPAFFSVAF